MNGWQLSQDTWTLTYEKIKDSLNSLKIFPQAGNIPSELENLGMNQYRIIYEIKQETVYIHLVCDARRDMKSVLTTRLLGC